MSLTNLGCEEVVYLAWTSTNGFDIEGDILAKVDKCGRDLKWWNQNVFGNVHKELERLKQLLPRAESEAMLSATMLGLDH